MSIDEINENTEPPRNRHQELDMEKIVGLAKTHWEAGQCWKCIFRTDTALAEWDNLDSTLEPETDRPKRS